MNRNYATEAVILSLKQIGENNSLVTILTKDLGIEKACLYGGPKSKLRSLCTQWNTGTIYIYDNPEKNQKKITDFDVKKYHISFSENLFKSYAALLAAEIIIKTECAGGGENNLQCWELLNGFFDGLEIATEEQGKTGLIRFLWRFIHLSGLLPQTEECETCGNNFYKNSPIISEKNSQLYYNISNNCFICSECFSEMPKGLLLPVSQKGLFYLHSVINLPPSQSRNVPIDENDFNQIKQIVFNLAEEAANGPLNTIRIGTGIL